MDKVERLLAKARAVMEAADGAEQRGKHVLAAALRKQAQARFAAAEEIAQIRAVAAAKRATRLMRTDPTPRPPRFKPVPLSAEAVRRALVAMAARTPAEVPPGPTMQERIRQRLRDAVHDLFAREAARASEIGDPWAEHPLGCPAPDVPEPEPEDPVVLVPHYPIMLGIQGVLRRRAWLAEHRQRLLRLVIQA